MPPKKKADEVEAEQVDETGVEEAATEETLTGDTSGRGSNDDNAPGVPAEEPPLIGQGSNIA